MIMDSNQKRTRLLVGMVIITFLAFFLGLGFVDNRLRVIEDHLQSIIGSPESATAKNIVYVPAYSHVYAHNGHTISTRSNFEYTQHRPAKQYHYYTCGLL